MAFSEELRELSARASNWGRWGDDDQLGCGNFLTPASAQRGAASVRIGERVSLALPLRADGVQVGQPAGRYNPILTFTTMNERDRFVSGIWEGTDDLVTMSTAAATHIDCLSHMGYEDTLYGGRSQSASVRAGSGATWCGAEQLPAIATRGILLDIPVALGVERLEAGHAVTAEQLDSALLRTGLTVESGDALCIRTGDVQWYLEGDRQRYAVGVDWQVTGLGTSCIEWFHDREVAGVFLDTYAYEVMPPETGNWDDLCAVHMIQLRDMGLLQGQNWNFEPLAQRVAADGHADFLLVAVPEPIVGATSTPVAPLALR